MQPVSGNQRPDLLTSLMDMFLVLRLHFSRSSSNVPRLPSFLEMLANPHIFSHFWLQCTIPCACHAKRSEHVVFFNILTWKCSSRHNSVHFFDISTSKSGPSMVCFAHFDFEMCFAPQRRALFRHLNFQKWSENGVLCTA